jgi:hypothetical protein
LLSPVQHAHAACPPTLLFGTKTNRIVPAQSILVLHHELVSVSVSLDYVKFMVSEHIFDLVLPWIPPIAQATWQYVDHFLAVLM